MRVRCMTSFILVPRGRAPFGQHQESRPLAKSNTGSPRFTDFPSLCACSESSLTILIGSGLNLLCLKSHSKTECRWTRPEVAILAIGADQKERGLWGREWTSFYSQTACSFDGNFANFRRNIGILVDSLSRASCNQCEQVAQFIWYLMPRTR